MSEYIQVVSTFEKKSDAEKTAREVLEQRCAACVQIVGPITSMFWWKDKIENTEEYLCIMKSRDDLYNNLEKVIKESHPYDVPEILSVPVTNGSTEYFDWLSTELGHK